MTLAKGLTGAHTALGAVVIDAPARNCSKPDAVHGADLLRPPTACAAGVAAMRAYDGKRSSAAGSARMFAALQALQHYHPSIGDVRGGDGCSRSSNSCATAHARTARAVAADAAGVVRWSIARATPAFRSPHAAT
jgi:4-aminobutyrate aminotransferase-like enzyme